MKKREEKYTTSSISNIDQKLQSKTSRYKTAIDKWLKGKKKAKKSLKIEVSTTVVNSNNPSYKKTKVRVLTAAEEHKERLKASIYLN